ncbi:glycine cleavage system aminomethyltransferase GcvT [Haloferula sp.]|uniref:glycine cleavage system aminomethyltransferase GcvT n=1 Tax=Haloferula sp. TaxID=2497595 RepID=UPI003C794BC6
MSGETQESPLKELHERLGARMVPFAGWNMPVMYSSILSEHSAVREKAGIFDISHMGQFVVRGVAAGEWLDGVLTNHVGSLGDAQGQYTMMLNEKGGVIDDLILYRVSAEEFFLVVNASMIDEDFAWLQGHLVAGVELANESDEWAGMAVQGPDSVAVFARLFADEELPPRNGIAKLSENEVVCRTGYTGEDGFEFFCPAHEGERMFEAFVAAGATPCGLGARDTLRLEMCYPLNGSDLSPERTPLEAGLGFFVDLEKGDFVGREVLARQKQEGLKQRLVALEYLEKGAPPRAHYKVVMEDGTELGELGSGVLSPSLGNGIALAYLPVESAKLGTAVWIDVRGRRFPAQVVKKPFYKPTANKG